MGLGHLQTTEILSRAQGAMWRGLAAARVLPVGRNPRVQGQVWPAKPVPSSNSKAEDQGHLQCPKDSDSDRAEGAGAGNHPHPQQSSSHCRGAAFGVAIEPGALPAPVAAGLVEWRSCRRQGCLITEQPWKPATAAALWPGGEAAGL